MPVSWALGVSTTVFALVHEHNTGDTIQVIYLAPKNLINFDLEFRVMALGFTVQSYPCTVYGLTTHNIYAIPYALNP
jgi:hypothetical protein